MNFIALDLEMNQPSGTIIQIGAVVGDIRTGEIKARFSRMVNPREAIAPFITELTGITQEMADRGTTLLGAYKELVAFKEKYKARKQIIAWGGGDVHTLRTQLKLNKETDSWVFGHRFFDTKTIFQAFMLADGRATKAGLKKALQACSIEFQGREHDAEADALNTFILFQKLIQKLKNGLDRSFVIPDEV